MVESRLQPGNTGRTKLRGVAEGNVIHLQCEFQLARVIWLCVASDFVRHFFLLRSKNEWHSFSFSNNGVLSGFFLDLSTVQQWQVLDVWVQFRNQAPENGMPHFRLSQWAKMAKSNIKGVLICFFNIHGIVHKIFLPQGHIVDHHFYLQVL